MTLVDGLHSVLRPFLLRRFKSQVLQKSLPPKREYTIFLEPTPLQKKLFSHVLNLNTPLNNRVMQLKKICNHPALFDKHDKFFDSSNINYSEPKYTIKVPVLLQIVSALLEKGHRPLIFSQMTKMLEILQEVLTDKKYQTFLLDGTTPTLERDEMVRMQNSCDVFLLSTRAGGLGLNLSSFDTVLIYDSDWVSNYHL